MLSKKQNEYACFNKQFKVLLFIGIHFICFNGTAQIISKTLPEPKVWILGVIADDFPKYNGNWEDTIAVKTYGQKVEKWLFKHDAFKKEMSMKKEAKESIDRVYLNGLTPEEKQKFKLIVRKLTYAIEPQRSILRSEFAQANPMTKANRKSFYLDAEQVYFLHESNIIEFKKAIKN